MPIIYDEKNKVFNISTPNTTYLCGLYEDRFLNHIYYGEKITSGLSVEDTIAYSGKGFSVYNVKDEKIYSSDELLQLEYPCFGSADLRTPAFHARYKSGSTVTKLEYSGYKIYKGKPGLEGLPAAYVESDKEADTLEIVLEDRLTGLKIILMYTAYNDRDVISRSVRAENCGSDNIEVLKMMSMSIDMFDGNYEFVHLSGAYARERYIHRSPIIEGDVNISSNRGHSGHKHNPFFCSCT